MAHVVGGIAARVPGKGTRATADCSLQAGHTNASNAKTALRTLSHQKSDSTSMSTSLIENKAEDHTSPMMKMLRQTLLLHELVLRTLGSSLKKPPKSRCFPAEKPAVLGSLETVSLKPLMAWPRRNSEMASGKSSSSETTVNWPQGVQWCGK